MKNIELWQYFVIAGPAFMLGLVAAYLIDRAYVRGLEDLVLNYHGMRCLNCARKLRSAKEISRRILEDLHVR